MHETRRVSMLRSLKISGVLVAIVFAAITFALWAWMNRPVDEPGWPERGLQVVAFSPFRAGQDPDLGVFPRFEQIDADLRLLSDASIAAVRTYSTLNSLVQIPELAARYQIKVTLGAWLNENRRLNEREVANTIALANEHENVIRVIVGNRSAPPSLGTYGSSILSSRTTSIISRSMCCRTGKAFRSKQRSTTSHDASIS